MARRVAVIAFAREPRWDMSVLRAGMLEPSLRTPTVLDA